VWKPPQRGCNGEAVSEDEEPPRDKTIWGDFAKAEQRRRAGEGGGRVGVREKADEAWLHGRQCR
jgi:hypothetical protein